MNQCRLKKEGSNRKYITKEEDGRSNRILVVSDPAIQFSADEEEWLRALNMSHVRVQTRMPKNFKIYEVSLKFDVTLAVRLSALAPKLTRPKVKQI